MLNAAQSLAECEQRTTPISIDVEPLQAQRIRALLSFEKIDSLYQVGARGGEAELGAKTAFDFLLVLGPQWRRRAAIAKSN